MKKYYLFIALAMVAAMSVSCKNNNKKAKEAADATAEVVEAAKTILADDVLATLDEIAKSFIDDAGKVEAHKIIAANLTPEERMVKPDYLLDPKDVNSMVTKSQKLNALAILMMERDIRKAYEMPIDKVDETMTRLMAELNHPNSFENNFKMSIPEKVAETYRQYKERGDLASFWQFSFAFVNEMAYLVSQNPYPFFRNLTEKQFAIFNSRFFSCYAAVKELAKYDEQVAEVLKIFEENRCVDTYEESVKAFGSLASAKQTIIDTKDVIAARRSNLLK